MRQFPPLRSEHLQKVRGLSGSYDRYGRCDRCGLTYRGFVNYGRFGCADCYRAFAWQVERLLPSNFRAICSNPAPAPIVPTPTVAARSQRLSQQILSVEGGERATLLSAGKVASEGSIYHFPLLAGGRLEGKLRDEWRDKLRDGLRSGQWGEARDRSLGSLRAGSNWQDRVILTVRLRIARNLAGLPYAGLLSRRQRRLLARAILSPNSILVQRLTGSISGKSAPKSSQGLSREIYRRLYSGDEDHLRVEWIFPWQGEKNGLKSLINCFQEADMLDNLYHWQYTPKHGYQTACPAISGSAMRLSFRLFTPALRATGRLEDWIGRLSALGYELRGFRGEESSYWDGLQISNGYLPFPLDYEKELRSLFVLLKRLELAEWGARGNLSLSIADIEQV